MAEFTDQIKREVVLAFARFATMPEVVAMVREVFDVETSIQQVRTYNPTHPMYEAGEKWLPMFESAREEFIKGTSEIPVANQGYRLNRLSRLIDKAEKAGNLVLAASLLEQAAKEVGGVLTNERNLKVENNKGSFRDLEPEERRNMVADMFAGLGLNGNAPGAEKVQ